MDVALKPLKVNSDSAVDSVVSALRNEIIKGTFKPGDRLPSEAELVRELGVSRSTVREAMKVLQSCGVVDIRQGNGTFVAKAGDESSIQMQVLRYTLLQPTENECWDFRALFEKIITKNAILYATPAVISELQENLDKMKRVRTNAEATALLDLQFHQILAKATPNSLIRNSYAVAMSFLEPSYIRNHAISNHVDITISVHTDTINAIKERNASDEMIDKIIKKNETAWKQEHRENR